MSVVNPYNTTSAGASTSGDGYTMDQDAIIGVMPENSETDTYAAGDYKSGTVSFETTLEGSEEVSLGASAVYTITVKNTGDEYQGKLYVFLDGENKSKIGVAIAAGGTENYEVNMTFASEGTHTIIVSDKSDGTNVLAQKTVTVAASENVINGLIADIEVSGAQEVDGELVAYSSSVTITYKFTNVTDSTYNGKVNVLYGNGSPNQGWTITLNLGAKKLYLFIPIKCLLWYDFSCRVTVNSTFTA